MDQGDTRTEPIEEGSTRTEMSVEKHVSPKPKIVRPTPKAPVSMVLGHSGNVVKGGINLF